jgi:hypothetical protein
LNRFVAGFVGPSFAASAAVIEDADGARTDAYTAVVHSAHGTPDTDGVVRADDAAVAICAVERLYVENLRAAYAQLTQAKRLRKQPVPQVPGTAHTNRTLTIMLALRSALPMETVALELERLNAETPDMQWPDMVAVASTGTVQYAVQWPGEGLSGDFLPPAEGALQNFVPPMYVVLVLRPSGERTLNRMLAFLIAHLWIFTPGAPLPRWDGMLEGVSKSAVVVTGYQYNHAGALVPVPPEMYNERYIAPRPLRIEDARGEVLSTVELIPWQDGGVILMRGKLPLEALLLFFDVPTTKRVGRVQRPDAEISFVLPITPAVFDEMLRRFQRQSNMVVRVPDVDWVIQKAADEGSQSPFMARILIGILRLRDAVYPQPGDRGTFDKRYDVATSALFTARAAAQEVQRLWTEHERKVASGEIARVAGGAIRIDESIEQEFRRQVETFLNAAVRAVKQGMQEVGAELGVDIGFLFKKQGAFDAGVAAMEATDSPLAAYLRLSRSSWSELLVERRNAVEHEGWVLPNARYRQTIDGVQATEPEIDGRPASAYVASILDRVTCFVEEFTAHCLQRRLAPEITITEIGRADRVEEMPERFSVTLANGGLPRWAIAYHTSPFEET